MPLIQKDLKVCYKLYITSFTLMSSPSANDIDLDINILDQNNDYLTVNCNIIKPTIMPNVVLIPADDF